LIIIRLIDSGRWIEILRIKEVLDDQILGENIYKPT